MRFFIALEIPDENKQELKLVQEKIKQILPDIRLTDNDKLHLTIAFVGEQPEEIKNDLIKVISNAVAGISNFVVIPAYIDGFPNIHHPHTIWVGVKGEIDKLLLMEERVKDGLKELQLPVDERRYIPHIAVAKADKYFELTSLKEKLLQNTTSSFFSEGKQSHGFSREAGQSHGLFDPIEIKSIKLFESIPEGGLHTHNTLAEIKLSA
ncbi:RNA 2',3'-cyclic phosphodiesterase [Candidatus Daviesbacteria bacterium]|nr:RNA 2',3'-cyclic phosphodiesterase [Candidatus Daviesbacteria bacterium]